MYKYEYLGSTEGLESYMKKHKYLLGYDPKEKMISLYKKHDDTLFECSREFSSKATDDDHQYLICEFIKRAIADVSEQILKHDFDKKFRKARMDLYSKLKENIDHLGVYKKSTYQYPRTPKKRKFVYDPYTGKEYEVNVKGSCATCDGWGCYACCNTEQEIRSKQGTFG